MSTTVQPSSTAHRAPDPILSHFKGITPGRRRRSYAKYNSLYPAIEHAHAAGFSGRDICDEIQKFEPWKSHPTASLYSAICYHIRVTGLRTDAKRSPKSSHPAS